MVTISVSQTWTCHIMMMSMLLRYSAHHVALWILMARAGLRTSRRGVKIWLLKKVVIMTNLFQ